MDTGCSPLSSVIITVSGFFGKKGPDEYLVA